MMQKISTLTGIGGAQAPLLIRGGTTVGLLQGHLAELLGLSISTMSWHIVRQGLPAERLSRSEAGELKKLGLIHVQSRGGNFLPVASASVVLAVLAGEVPANLKKQIEHVISPGAQHT